MSQFDILFYLYVFYMSYYVFFRFLKTPYHRISLSVMHIPALIFFIVNATYISLAFYFLAVVFGCLTAFVLATTPVFLERRAFKLKHWSHIEF